MRLVWAAVIVCLCACASADNRVVVAPAPKGAAMSSDYRVTVNGKADVIVTTGIPLGHVVIRPESLYIAAGAVVQGSAHAPGIEVSGEVRGVVYR